MKTMKPYMKEEALKPPEAAGAIFVLSSFLVGSSLKTGLAALFQILCILTSHLTALIIDASTILLYCHDFFALLSFNCMQNTKSWLPKTKASQMFFCDNEVNC